MKLFAQIRKVDEEKRLVFGRAAEEAVDKAGEIMDYASSKPHFQKWSETMSKDTDGKNLGNVRAMHGKVAAGGLTAIEFDDAAKTIDVCAKILDDNEWKKVLGGVYTGFSIGGDYVGDKTVEKVDGVEATRYTARPNEVSLVDRPCMSGAKFFEVQKADGAVATVDFVPGHADDMEITGTADEVAEFGKLMNSEGLSIGDILKAMPAFIAAKKKPHGTDDTDVKDDANVEANGDEAKKKAGVKAGVKAAPTTEKALSPEELKKAELATLRKSMYACSSFAQVIASLQSLQQDAAYSAFFKGDDTGMGAKFAACISLCGSTLKDMIDAELADLTDAGADTSSVMEMAAKCGELAKFDGDPIAVLSAKPLAKVEETSALEKMVQTAIEPLQKVLDAQRAQIAKLEAQPAPARVSLRAVDKGDEMSGTVQKREPAAPVVDDHGEKHEAAGLIKSLHSTGGAPLNLPQALR